jgi:AraC family transcriptional regulator, regulatory protein of adaptative response / DNA-3-methyladenine glycosylase II
MQEMASDPTVLERARLSRDPRFDGKFFIAVTSTGIYCRPICPASPSPRRSNVRYFSSAAAAAEAGFRPCLRCRPEAAPGTPAWLGTSAVVRRALRLINEGALDEASVGEFATRVGVGARHLDRLFLQHVGASPLALAQTRRLHFAKRLIDESDLPMTQIALAAGFGSLRRFNDAFQKAYRRSPRELRRERSEPPARGAGDEVSLALSYRPPYDWDHLRDFLALRATPGVERVEAQSYCRLIRTDAGHAVINVRPLPGKDALQLRVQGAPPSALFQIATAARRVFDLSADPTLLGASLAADPLFRPLVRRRPGIRIPGSWDPFECAVRAVLGQQVTVAASRTLAGRLVARAGEPVASVAGLDRLFPTPAALVAANLDGLGLTGARINAVRSLANAVAAGRIAFDRPSDEIVARLIELPGFGEWTAQYIALRALGEPDAFLAADLVVRRTAGGAAGALTIRELERRAEAWRPWRGYAVMHLWCAAADRHNPGELQ